MRCSRVHEFTEARAALAEYGKHVHESFLVEPLASIDDGEGSTEAALAARATARHRSRARDRLCRNARRSRPLRRRARAHAEGDHERARHGADVRRLAAVSVGPRLRAEGRARGRTRLLSRSTRADARLRRDARAPRADADRDRRAGRAPRHCARRTTAIPRCSRSRRRHPAREPNGWERYVAALPDAFADHAARFYLGTDEAGPRARARAHRLRKSATRLASRALVVEAALAAGDAASACAVVEPLVSGAPSGAPIRCLEGALACGRNAEADRLAASWGS